MLPIVYQHPQMDFESVLSELHFKKISKEAIISNIPMFVNKFSQIGRTQCPDAKANWIMGELNSMALGNISMEELKNIVKDN
ncbi:MAG: hypothetical protein J6W04_02890 [Bacteroidales bacterium]|nr:hypothetical protein [Bacteroidales bacterium]